jgi:1,5-anhydro-D-fructose reductase (1,5-anhydro-D-mannitol-forming)
MKKLNFAIIGYGKMGEIRYNTLKKLPGCSVSWVCEPDQKNLNLPNIKCIKKPDDILKDQSVDVVVICTPNHFLKDLVVKSLNAGKHVFCEKPPGRNMAELKEMMKAEQKNKKCKLMFGFNHRHHESMLHAKKLIDSGEYGKILWMRGRYGKSVDEKFFSNWRSKKDLAGGGIFLDQGIHMLDLFLMLCGDFEEVEAFVSNLYWKLAIEDNVFAIFRNKKGQVASLHSTMTQWRHIFSLEIFLERGYITVNGLKTSSNTYGDEEMTIAQNRSLPPAAMWTEEENLTFHTDYSWEKEMKVFVDSIRNNKAIPTGNTKDAMKLMTLVEKVYKSHKRKK